MHFLPFLFCAFHPKVVPHFYYVPQNTKASRAFVESSSRAEAKRAPIPGSQTHCTFSLSPRFSFSQPPRTFPNYHHISLHADERTPPPRAPLMSFWPNKVELCSNNLLRPTLSVTTTSWMNKHLAKIGVSFRSSQFNFWAWNKCEAEKLTTVRSWYASNAYFFKLVKSWCNCKYW